MSSDHKFAGSNRVCPINMEEFGLTYCINHGFILPWMKLDFELTRGLELDLEQARYVYVCSYVTAAAATLGIP